MNPTVRRVVMAVVFVLLAWRAVWYLQELDRRYARADCQRGIVAACSR